MRMRFRDKKVDRDWLNSNFPCMMACPAGTNAGRYVALIAEGQFEEAYRWAREPNPMASVCGRVCAHPCETACRRGAIDKPIAIRALKRFLTERYGPESRHPLAMHREPVPKLPYRVAVVGSGPVGLSAAHDLAIMGYPVTIFDAAPVAGGMLRLGIPEYRLPRSVVDAQIREILEVGDVTLKLNSAAGRDYTISGLRSQGFDAVVIAVGAHRSRDLSIPGVDLDGVHKGIDFLLNANLGYRFNIGKKVVVIGGGNVAMDVARSAAREVLKQHARKPRARCRARAISRPWRAMKWWTSRFRRCAWGRAKWELSASKTGNRCRRPWRKSRKPRSKASSCMTAEDPSRWSAVTEKWWVSKPSKPNGSSTRPGGSIRLSMKTASR